MKIALYGSCGYPFFFREMILRAQERKIPIQLSMLVLSWRHFALFKDVLPVENKKDNDQIKHAAKRNR